MSCWPSYLRVLFHSTCVPMRNIQLGLQFYYAIWFCLLGLPSLWKGSSKRNKYCESVLLRKDVNLQTPEYHPGSYSFSVILTWHALSPLSWQYVQQERRGGKEAAEKKSLQWNILLKALNCVMKNCGCDFFFNYFVIFDENDMFYIQKDVNAGR